MLSSAILSTNVAAMVLNLRKAVLFQLPLSQVRKNILGT